MAIVVKDSFNRPNTSVSSTGLGKADTGQLWQPYRDGVGRIQSNTAEISDLYGNDYGLVIDSGLSSFAIQATFLSSLGNSQLILAANEWGDSYLFLEHEDGSFTWTIYYFYRSSWIDYGSYTGGKGEDTGTIRAIVNADNNSIEVYLNGKFILSSYMPSGLSYSTLQGLGTGMNSVRFKDYMIEDLNELEGPIVQEGQVNLTAKGTISVNAQVISGTPTTGQEGLVALESTSSLSASAGIMRVITTPTPPDTIVSTTNLNGAVTAIQDDPSTPDNLWLTTTNTTSTALRVSFPIPMGNLNGNQIFRVLVRRNTSNSSGTGQPTVNIGLRIKGGSSNLITSSNTTLSNNNNQILTLTWNKTTYPTVLADGSNVELYVTGTAVGTGNNQRTVEVGAVQWVVSSLVEQKAPIDGSIELLSNGYLSTGAVKIYQSPTDLKAYGMLQSTGQTIRNTDITIQGKGVTQATSQGILGGTINPDGKSSLTTSGASTQQGIVNTSGRGDLSTSGINIQKGSTSTDGRGNLGISGTTIQLGILTIGGLGSAQADGHTTGNVQITIQGSGSLQVDSRVIKGAQADTGGSGLLSIEGALTKQTPSSISGSGAIVVGAVSIKSSSLNSTGKSGISGNPSAIYGGQSSMASRGTTDVSTDGTTFVIATVGISGQGGIQSTAHKSSQGSMGVNGMGTLLPAGTRILVASISSPGIGSILSDPRAIRGGQADMQGKGILEVVAEGVQSVVGQVSIAGQGMANISGHKIVSTVSTMPSSGIISPQPVRILKSISDIIGATSLSAKPSLLAGASILIAGKGSLIVQQATDVIGSVQMGGLSGLNAGAIVIMYSPVFVSGRSGIDAKPIRGISGQPVMNSIGDAKAIGIKALQGSLLSTGASGIQMTPTVIMMSSTTIQSHSTLEGLASALLTSGVTIKGISSVTALGMLREALGVELYGLLEEPAVLAGLFDSSDELIGICIVDAQLGGES